MDVDKIYRYMGIFFKRLYGFSVKRPLQRFNVDNRAERALDKQKEIPKSAPRHPGTEQLYRELSEENPQFRKQLDKRPDDLVSRLKSVKVVSKDVERSEEELKEMEEIRNKFKDRLPHSRHGSDLPTYAYEEPDFVPKGRISLLTALDFLGKHHKTPEKFPPEMISKKIDVKVEDVENMIMYFKPFYRTDFSDLVKDYDEETIGYFNSDRVRNVLRPSISKLTQREDLLDIDNKDTQKADESSQKDNINSEEISKDSKTETQNESKIK